MEEWSESQVRKLKQKTYIELKRGNTQRIRLKKKDRTIRSISGYKRDKDRDRDRERERD